MTTNPRSKSNSGNAGIYLARILKMNPYAHPEDVLALRRKALGIKKPATVDSGTVSVASEAEREKARSLVSELQNNFWTMPEAQLKQRIEALSANPLPELGPSISRLKTAASCRDQISQLSTLPDADPKLLMAFKAAAVLPAINARPFRERYFSSLNDQDQLRKAKAMVELIRTRFPEMYALESDWFSSILKMKKPHKLHYEPTESGGTEISLSWFWPVAIFGVILLRVLIRLMAN